MLHIDLLELYMHPELIRMLKEWDKAEEAGNASLACDLASAIIDDMRWDFTWDDFSKIDFEE